ncbi:transglycosylase SLT domain-containing protein [Amycolatopsis azurea]|nr:transglycosylase SLT domain-containing protein [Amycolatopsis azurea]EMD29629.1 hypothetical protein C791_2988 [Amycolatopsis azurea DSM 43854]
MADLSFNIVALDQASTTFMKAAAAAEHFADKLNRIDGQTVTADVNVRTDDSVRALDSFTTRFQLMSAGIVAASPLAGAAITAGIGASFVTVAALAQKSNEQVKQTYSTLWQNVVGETRAATNQLVPQIVGAGRQIGATFERLGPQLQTGFSAAGPAIVALTRGVTEFATNAMPGVTLAMQNSLPVFSGAANAAGALGTAVGSAVASVGQHSQAYGAYVQSLGNVTSSVLGTVVTIINDVATAWADNATKIDSAIGGMGETITGLASGVLPVFSSALNAAATVITTITDVLGPIAPILGTVGAAALATWGAFKLAGLATAGVNALAAGSVNLGVAMETASARSATMVASMQGTSVAASGAATAIRAAGASAATAAVGFGAAAQSIAGPLGIALVAGTLLLSSFGNSEADTTQKTAELKAHSDQLTDALIKNHGVMDQHIADLVKSGPTFQDAAGKLKQFGVSQEELIAIVTKGGSAYDSLRAKLAAIAAPAAEFGSNTKDNREELWQNADAATKAKMALEALAGEWGKNAGAAADSTRAAEENANKIVSSSAGHMAASETARTLGLSYGEVKAAFLAVASSAGMAGASIDSLRQKTAVNALASAKAGQTIVDTFTAADRQVVSAQQSVADAAHSYSQSIRAIADARHSAAQAARAVQQAEEGVADAQRGVVTAQRAVKDAVEGVASAQQAYARSQEQARDAERSLHDARQQSIQDLKELRLQMEDQTVSEQSARVRLFEAQQKAAGLGVTTENVASIAATPVTAENIDQVKTALDLRSAQNTLNNTMNSGVKLRQQVAEADRLGVEGSRGVVAAQRQVRDAHEQVANAAKGVQKAQQQVSDANYGLQQANRNLTRSHQAVADAAYGEQRAHQAVTDAQYASERSAGQLTRAKEALRDAEDNASRSFDLNTAAGQRNLTQLYALAGAIKTELGPTAEGYNRLIQETANKFGITTGEAQGLLQKLGEIPKDFRFGMTAVADIDAQHLWDKIPLEKGAPNPQLVGRPRMFADGGQISGPGGPRDDMIPLWASNREYIHPVDAVDHYGIGFMEAVRTKQFPKGWDGATIPRFAAGGMVGLAAANGALGHMGATYQAMTHAQIVMGLDHGPLLPKYVPPPVTFTNSNYTPGGGVARWTDLVLQVLTMLNLPAEILPKVLRRMNQESGGNPNAYNGWDVNAKNGIPSQGLMQTVPPTFAAYAGPFRDRGIMDPLASIYAGINYAGNKYGRSHGGFLGGVIYGMDKPGGYDNGGPLPPGLSTVWNGTGRPENVRTGAQEDSLLDAVRGVGQSIDKLKSELKLAVYESRRAPIEGTLRLANGALVGQIDAAFKEMEKTLPTL